VLAYIVRRVLYAIPILVGVNLITFVLFFFLNSPDDIARMQLGQKRVTRGDPKMKASVATTSRCVQRTSRGAGKLCPVFFSSR
jgi:ABC-type microcin C transport system permease subunit YejB